jgi:hypothetical protein
MHEAPSRRLGRQGRSIVLLLLALAACGLLGVGTASAASRGFLIHNVSRVGLDLKSVKPVPTGLCSGTSHCVKPYYPMDFEGRPSDGSGLDPDHWDWYELKYGFSPLGGIQYAADLVYEIEGTDATVEYRIEVWSTANTSECKVHRSKAYTCTARDTRLTFSDQRTAHRSMLLPRTPATAGPVESYPRFLDHGRHRTRNLEEIEE